MDNLHHQFLGLDGIDNILAHRLCLDGVCEILGHLEVDVGIKKSTAHFLEGLGYVYFGNFALSLQDLKATFKFLA